MYRRHTWPALLWLAIATAPATAAGPAASTGPAGSTSDALTAMNAVDAAWTRYREAVEARDGDAADLVAESTARHYAFLRDVARFASANQVRRLPSADRLIVYGLRSMHDDAELAALDGRGVYRLCVRRGLCGVLAEHRELALPALSHVTVVSPALAVGEIAPPTGDSYMFGPSFVHERGAWRPRPEELAPEFSQLIDAEADGDEVPLMQHLVGHYTGTRDTPPLLTALEMPLADDAAARDRLNETWPDYRRHVRARVDATRAKAESGEALAQWMYGSLLYSGGMDELAPKDPQRGLAMLEAASEGGLVPASMSVLQALLGTDDRATLTTETVRRALPHLRRAAVAGNPLAMATYGQFHADGAAGLEPDCGEGARWLRKAEDAGYEKARNDRFWLLATCVVPGQRDPATARALARHLIDNRPRLHAAELDTVAAVYAANADFAHAVEYQQEALARLDDDDGLEPDSRERMQARLALYRSGRDYIEHEPSYPTGR